MTTVLRDRQSRKVIIRGWDEDEGKSVKVELWVDEVPHVCRLLLDSWYEVLHPPIPPPRPIPTQMWLLTEYEVNPLHSHSVDSPFDPFPPGMLREYHEDAPPKDTYWIKAEGQRVAMGTYPRMEQHLQEAFPGWPRWSGTPITNMWFDSNDEEGYYRIPDCRGRVVPTPTDKPAT